MDYNYDCSKGQGGQHEGDDLGNSTLVALNKRRVAPYLEVHPYMWESSLECGFLWIRIIRLLEKCLRTLTVKWQD